MEAWIVNDRRKTCLACPQRHGCKPVRALDFWFAEAPDCPLHKIPSRNEAIAARAWPEGVPPVSGCCDPPALGY